MSFTQEYQKKLTTADEAVKVVKSGDRLEYGWCVTTPVALDEAFSKNVCLILKIFRFMVVSLCVH